ncbi:unnamed protein product [Echinostoma caproni]|uniref:PfkB domain-containing protein n=1 Tax=Echinostoma caproni TaxID=27848 RepID=A0A183AP90_9TREM|nr:unnamed protein product [Echinostoma caproni]
MEKLDVSVVGSINTDLSVYTDAVPEAGETVMGAEFIMGFGGKGANQCVATQFLGSKSAIVVGCDCFGDAYLEHLNKISVNTSKCQFYTRCFLSIFTVQTCIFRIYI